MTERTVFICESSKALNWTCRLVIKIAKKWGLKSMTDFVFKFIVSAEKLARIAKETVVAILEDAREKLESVSTAVLNLIETVLICSFALPFFWIERFFSFLRKYFEFEKNFQKNFDAFKEWYNEQNGENNE